METHANAVEDVMIDGLTYKLGAGASYITNRRFVTFHPQGSNIYSPQAGVRLIKVTLASDEYLDPSTVRVGFELNNLDAAANHELRPLSGPWGFFRRMRILIGSQIAEDIDNFNRMSEMFYHFTSSDYRFDVDVEGFDSRWDRLGDNEGNILAPNMRGIPAGQKKFVSFKPLSGLLAQGKYLPLRFAPITIELELVSDALDPIFTARAAIADANEIDADNTSQQWSIQNVEVKCDLCTLDNALDNQISQHLLEGKPLTLNYNTYISQEQVLGGNIPFSVNVNRAVSRLKAIYLTFFKTPAAGNAWKHKELNQFFHPMYSNAAGAGLYDNTLELEYQIQVGSKLFPEYPIRSVAEAFYQLRKCLGIASSPIHSFHILPKQYRSTHFAAGIDTEKVLEASYSGLNTRAGDLLTIKTKFPNAPANIAAASPDKMFITLQHDSILEIRDSGVIVFD